MTTRSLRSFINQSSHFPEKSVILSTQIIYHEIFPRIVGRYFVKTDDLEVEIEDLLGETFVLLAEADDLWSNQTIFCQNRRTQAKADDPLVKTDDFEVTADISEPKRTIVRPKRTILEPKASALWLSVSAVPNSRTF